MSAIKSFAVGLVGAASLFGAARADVQLNPASFSVRLYEDKTDNDKGVTSKYQVRASGQVFGTVGDHDRMTLAWKSGGKTLSTVDCDLQALTKYGQFSCEGKDSLDAFGDVTAVLSYVTDADDKSLALHTMNLKVGRFWNWYMRGNKTLTYARYQVMPMDVLGDGVITYLDGNGNAPNGNVRLSFWGLRVGDEEYAGGKTLRCTVDGKQVGDWDAGTSGSQIVEAEDWRGPNLPKHSVHWETHSVILQDLLWGTAKPERDSAIAMGAFPGAWTCDWRLKGKVVRQFAWKVGADGRIKPHAEQAAGLKLPSDMVMVDVTVPDSAPDKFFDADAVRASGFFGRAWSDAATNKSQKNTKSRPGVELAAPKGAKAAPKAKKKK